MRLEPVIWLQGSVLKPMSHTMMLPNSLFYEPTFPTRVCLGELAISAGTKHQLSWMPFQRLFEASPRLSKTFFGLL